MYNLSQKNNYPFIFIISHEIFHEDQEFNKSPFNLKDFLKGTLKYLLQCDYLVPSMRIESDLHGLHLLTFLYECNLISFEISNKIKNYRETFERLHNEYKKLNKIINQNLFSDNIDNFIVDINNLQSQLDTHALIGKKILINIFS